nr:unnamed protein product [Callosobruchus chinensis]
MSGTEAVRHTGVEEEDALLPPLLTLLLLLLRCLQDLEILSQTERRQSIADHHAGRWCFVFRRRRHSPIMGTAIPKQQAFSHLQPGEHAGNHVFLQRQDLRWLLRRSRHAMPDVPHLCQGSWSGGPRLPIPMSQWHSF